MGASRAARVIDLRLSADKAYMADRVVMAGSSTGACARSYLLLLVVGEPVTGSEGGGRSP